MAVDEIRQTPALLEECSRSRRQLDLLAEPAGGQEVERALAPLVLVFGLGEQATARAFWAVYRDALGDMPKVALDRAVAEWPRVGKFFPKPAEIRELAEPHAQAFRQASYRAAKALEAPAQGAEVPKERADPQKVAALMAEFKRTIADIQSRNVLDRTKNRQIKPSCARVDETGMSAEMRAVMQQQRGA